VGRLTKRRIERRPQGSEEPQVGAQVKTERAEILDLISKLREASGGTLPRHMAAMVQPAPRIADVAYGREATARRPASVRPHVVAPHGLPASQSPQEASQSLQEDRGQQADIVASLQNIEKRLEDIEARLSSRDGAGRSNRPRSAVPASNEPSTFQGEIQEQMLSDMLQLVCANAMNGIFTVESETAKTRLYFREGKMFHAEGEDIEGESAFFAAFAVEVGRYSFLDTEDLPDNNTISASTQFLILDALRQIDENRKSLMPPGE